MLEKLKFFLSHGSSSPDAASATRAHHESGPHCTAVITEIRKQIYWRWTLMIVKCASNVHTGLRSPTLLQNAQYILRSQHSLFSPAAPHHGTQKLRKLMLMKAASVLFSMMRWVDRW
jgi:hypothetical protein